MVSPGEVAEFERYASELALEAAVLKVISRGRMARVDVSDVEALADRATEIGSSLACLIGALRDESEIAWAECPIPGGVSR